MNNEDRYTLYTEIEYIAVNDGKGGRNYCMISTDPDENDVVINKPTLVTNLPDETLDEMLKECKACKIVSRTDEDGNSTLFLKRWNNQGEELEITKYQSIKNRKIGHEGQK